MEISPSTLRYSPSTFTVILAQLNRQLLEKTIIQSNSCYLDTRAAPLSLHKQFHYIEISKTPISPPFTSVSATCPHYFFCLFLTLVEIAFHSSDPSNETSKICSPILQKKIDQFHPFPTLCFFSISLTTSSVARQETYFKKSLLPSNHLLSLHLPHTGIQQMLLDLD